MLFIHIVVIVCYVLVCIMLSGESTTDTFRLIKGADQGILERDCCCSSCGRVIPIYEQIPVLSYLICKGRCRKCRARIPVSHVVQEALLLVLYIGCGIITGFTWISALIDLAVYEIYKIIVIIIFGKRKKNFALSYLISLLMNLLLYGGLIMFLLAVGQIFK